MKDVRHRFASIVIFQACLELLQMVLYHGRVKCSSAHCFSLLRSFALRVLAFAAALEAFVANSLRSFAVIDLARAMPPWRANSLRACLSSSASTMRRCYTLLAR
jgi:hypothetical protein